MYRMRVGQVPGDNNQRLVSKEKEPKRICAECQYWEAGDSWGTGHGKHGLLIESKGWCTFKKNKRKRWNYCNACKDFSKQPRTGFIYQGGDHSIEEDMENVMQLTENLINGEL